MRAVAAAALVFLCSAAVLMLEILAGRLLAPYVGVSLETYTAVIGTMLAGIALGAWGGGWLADRIDPRRSLGPLVLAGGALAVATVPVVRAFGDASGQGGAAVTVLLAMAGFFLPAAVLSAVTPTVVKLQLRDLEHTGGVVGQLSGVGTLGALVGTFVTGFLLVATAPTRGVIYGIGGFLVVLGLGLWLVLSRQDAGVLASLLLVTAGAGALAAVVDEPCQVESAYFCMRVERDPLRASGRILRLDNLRHSYVDLDDPTHLEFAYTNAFSDVVRARWPDADALDVVHVGGGGFTMPRYLEVTNPGTRSEVYEIDPAVVQIARDELGLETDDDLRVRVGDARLGLRGRADDSADLVIGDAFGGLSVPWHLATREFVAEVDRVLRPDGVYVINVIDYSPFRFARAELATLQEQFAHVALLASEEELAGLGGGNVVLVASQRPLDLDAIGAQAADQGDAAASGAQLDAFVAGAPVIRDDFAPVDQWLSRSGT